MSLMHNKNIIPMNIQDPLMLLYVLHLFSINYQAIIDNVCLNVC